MAYTKNTNFTAKDALASGNPSKIIKGSEIDAEFDEIATEDALSAKLAGDNVFTSSNEFSGIATFSGTIAGGSPFVLEGATADDFETTLAVTDPTADRTITIPDATGTMALTYQIGRKNAIINGNFDIWQRGTSQSTSGYLSADRWTVIRAVDTFTASQQAFTLGQTDVPNNPTYHYRYANTHVVGVGNRASLIQRIEGVETFSGETATLSFWAKASSGTPDIATEFVQDFGTGGSPSSDVTAIGVTTHSLTTSWQKFTATVSISSISGKTLGSNNDDYLSLIFWISAGSDWDARTNSLGQQTVTVDIAQVQIEKGSTATDFEQRPIGEELSLCQRYFQHIGFGMAGGATDATTLVLGTTFNVPMRAAPSLSLSDTSIQVRLEGSTNATSTGSTITDSGTNPVGCWVRWGGYTGLVDENAIHGYQDFLYVDAEL